MFLSPDRSSWKIPVPQCALSFLLPQMILSPCFHLTALNYMQGHEVPTCLSGTPLSCVTRHDLCRSIYTYSGFADQNLWIVFQPKIWLLKNIKFDVRIGTWMSSSIHLRCWLMRVKDFWAPFILVSSSWWLRAELRLSCHLMWCFAKNSWIFYFFKILYSHFEAPRNVEKLSELIFAGLPLQTINLYRLVSYSSRP